MTDDGLRCWKCGAPLAGVPRPIGRQALCPSCSAYLHVCRMCQYFDARVSGGCTEERAEEVTDKTHMNFCDYYRARPRAHQLRSGNRAVAARGKLDELFGASQQNEPQSRNALDELFDKKKDEKP